MQQAGGVREGLKNIHATVAGFLGTRPGYAYPECVVSKQARGGDKPYSTWR